MVLSLRIPGNEQQSGKNGTGQGTNLHLFAPSPLWTGLSALRSGVTSVSDKLKVTTSHPLFSDTMEDQGRPNPTGTLLLHYLNQVLLLFHACMFLPVSSHTLCSNSTHRESAPLFTGTAWLRLSWGTPRKKTPTCEPQPKILRLQSRKWERDGNCQ